MAGNTSTSSTRRMLRGSLLVPLTTSAYQRFAKAATVSVARPACTAVGDLVRPRFGLQSLGSRIDERHACPCEARDSVPHAIF
jgi:hypothetical protein